MSHLVQEYAKACGVKIGKPIVSPIFYPIPYDKYITIYHGNCPATTYAYWDEVIELLRPAFSKQGIKIVQLLDNEAQIIPLADKHVVCSKKQANFIINGGKCHVGVDSIHSYFAGENAKPLVILYSHTNPKNTEPWRTLASKTEYISSVKEGEKPSYDPNENPRTINSILPERIAQSILHKLGLKQKLKFKSLLIGSRYKEVCLDIVPTHPTNVISDRINVRMDIHHDENILSQILSNNVAEVTLSAPISDSILNSRKISIINYIAEKFDEVFVKRVKSLGIHLNLLCVSEETLAEQRFIFFDYDVSFLDLKKIIQDNSARFNGLASERIKTKSNKKIIIGDKEYFSYLDALKSKELFLLDLDWLYLYTLEQ